MMAEEKPAGRLLVLSTKCQQLIFLVVKYTDNGKYKYDNQILSATMSVFYPNELHTDPSSCRDVMNQLR
ncbi:hypothetical protein OZK63_39535, partial [Streptomyces sp. UMAF16]|nr:hypothetical protein [Streptomyces sp. UMAF16]